MTEPSFTATADKAVTPMAAFLKLATIVCPAFFDCLLVLSNCLLVWSSCFLRSLVSAFINILSSSTVAVSQDIIPLNFQVHH